MSIAAAACSWIANGACLRTSSAASRPIVWALCETAMFSSDLSCLLAARRSTRALAPGLIASSLLPPWLPKRNMLGAGGGGGGLGPLAITAGAAGGGGGLFDALAAIAGAAGGGGGGGFPCVIAATGLSCEACVR